MSRETQLTALMIAPNRDLAQAFAQTHSATQAFHVLSEMKSFLTGQALELRLRQLKPDVVLLDLSSGLDQALELIQIIQGNPQKIHVVGLHTSNDSEVLVRSFRAGASEFLYAPFDASTMLDSAARIQKLLRPDASTEPEFAFVLGFTSTKPGSGASTLAAQTAFALRRMNKRKVLLMDLDLMGGTVGFYVKIQNHNSVLSLLESEGDLEPSLWNGLTVNANGVDILPAPEEPSMVQLDQGRLHEILEFARRKYDWIILDMPSIFNKTTLLGVPESDLTFLVTTSELPSLHLTRKSIAMIKQLGFESSRFQVVVNRLDKRDGISGSDMEKMFNTPVFTTIPNDYFSLHRVVTLGEPLGQDSELGRAIDSMAVKVSALIEAAQKASMGTGQSKLALMQA